MKYFATLFWLVLSTTLTPAQPTGQIFEFEFEGVVLNGVLNLPPEGPPKGIVVLVHGSGSTNAVAQDWHADVRATLVAAGYGTCMWDKMGCGQSGGTFDYKHPVQNSAAEVMAAFDALRRLGGDGSEVIGLWGISRAGWINPLVIAQRPDIAFWISVSGVDDKENFKYLLAENLKLNGHPPDSVDRIVGEWAVGVRITHSGGSFETYLAATTALRQNPFFRRFTGNTEISEAGYYAYQQKFSKVTLDEATGLEVCIPGFDSLLARIDCPVLAFFGEQDKNVDWTQTRALYERCLGERADLTVRSFPACNHNMFQCETGGFYEHEDDQLPYVRCTGFLETMADWLEER